MTEAGITGPGVEWRIEAPNIAVVVLNRPPVNALNRAARAALIGTFDALEADEDVRVIVLTAKGKVFCAGADIKEKAALASEPTNYAGANRLTRDGFFCILDSTKPVIAAVQGAALGAGCVLAACCDMIFAAESAFFGLPEVDVGQGGGASFMRRILPPSKVRRMMLTGERVPAMEFYRLGAVEVCLPELELMPAALGMASTIAAKPPGAVRRIRGAFPTVEALSTRDGFQLEQAYTTELSRSADGDSARRAFFERRRKGKS
jgi:enoyl-CoA hydratase